VPTKAGTDPIPQSQPCIPPQKRNHRLDIAQAAHISNIKIAGPGPSGGSLIVVMSDRIGYARCRFVMVGRTSTGNSLTEDVSSDLQTPLFAL
jgi:hypothetical protein